MPIVLAMANKTPWEVDPRLDQQALSTVGLLLLSLRRDVRARQQPERGDGRWGLGVCTHERFRYELVRLEEQGDYPWLSVVWSGQEFAFAINGCPIRKYKGDSEEPPTRQVERAQEQLELWPLLAATDPTWVWMLAVETDANGLGTQAVVLQANAASETRYRWVAARASDLDGGSSVPIPTGPIGPTPITPITNAPAPTVEPLASPETEKKPE